MCFNSHLSKPIERNRTEIWWAYCEPVCGLQHNSHNHHHSHRHCIFFLYFIFSSIYFSHIHPPPPPLAFRFHLCTKQGEMHVLRTKYPYIFIEFPVKYTYDSHCSSQLSLSVLHFSKHTQCDMILLCMFAHFLSWYGYIWHDDMVMRLEKEAFPFSYFLPLTPPPLPSLELFYNIMPLYKMLIWYTQQSNRKKWESGKGLVCKARKKERWVACEYEHCCCCTTTTTVASSFSQGEKLEENGKRNT